MGRRLKVLAIVLGLLGVGLGGTLWWFFRAEEIPDQLEAPEDPRTLVIPGIGSQPTLDASLLEGKTTFFVFAGIASMRAEEGQRINRALNRWILPEGVQGFIVFDAEGLGFLAEKSEEYMERFSSETRYPTYGDFTGAFRTVFKMPRGHHGLVVVSPQGEVTMRKSGGAGSDAELEEVRALLGAQEPPPGPAVPEFSLDSLDAAACAREPCAVMFLGRPITRKDIPGIDGGFEGEDEAKWAQMRLPVVRNVGSALKLELEGARGVIVGDVGDLELAPGWSAVADDARAREAFGLGPDADAFLILREGRVAFRGEGVIPMYELGRISDLLGAEFDFED
ncbi:MAG: hypothetical protein ACE37F_09670 [Nannocystaceae bacterium]|nr:hypothetical protein [bacterium]